MSPLTFDQEQIQKLTEIGAHLRSIRTQKRISIDDVVTKTMIQKRFLEAIEKGQPEDLPEALYVRGFIRRYADMLGLNGTQLSEAFPLGSESLASTNTNGLLNSGSGVALRPWHLYIFYTVLILLAGLGLSYVLSRQTAPKAGNSGGASLVQPVSSASPKPKPVAAKKPASPAAPVAAQLTLKADAYLEVLADGQSAYTGTLRAGSTRNFTAKREIRLFTGNAGGVTLGVNGRAAKVMGNAGEVKEVTLTPTSR